jgi:hypothetical protein
LSPTARIALTPVLAEPPAGHRVGEHRLLRVGVLREDLARALLHHDPRQRARRARGGRAVLEQRPFEGGDAERAAGGERQTFGAEVLADAPLPRVGPLLGGHGSLRDEAAIALGEPDGRVDQRRKCRPPGRSGRPPGSGAGAR